MRMKYDNIKFVRVLTRDDVPYEWSISLSHRVSDSRTYYSIADVPKCVIKFINEHEGEISYTETWKPKDADHESKFVHVVYKK